jgi:hypothetical protein
MKIAHLLLILPLPLVLGSCDKPPAKHEEAAPGTKPVAKAITPKPVDYLALGVPAANREWSPFDFDHAVRALAKLPPESLPRFEISGGVFERMVAHDNLNLIRNTTLPVSQRMGAAAGYSQGVNSLLKLYALHPYQSGDLKEEALALMDMTMNCAASMLPLADEFMASLPPAEQTPVRKESLKNITSGMEQTFSGAIVCLGESHIWTEQQRVKLAQSLERSVASAWPFLTDDFKKEVPIRLKERFDATSENSLKDAISKLRETISKL